MLGEGKSCNLISLGQESCFRKRYLTLVEQLVRPPRRRYWSQGVMAVYISYVSVAAVRHHNQGKL